MAYGQHQSFYLRDRWLSKIIKHLKNDERFFYDKEAFEKIGLGKNMVQSLRFWVVATNVVDEQFNDERKKVHLLTQWGNLLYKYDRFIQLKETASILHFYLSKTQEPATIWYWFYNIYSKPTTTKEELLKSFSYWVEKNEKRKVSINSLKRDVDCFVKLYTAGIDAEDPEEVIQSPLNKTNLLNVNNGNITVTSSNAENVGLSALMYILLDYAEENEFNTVSVPEIATSKCLWGKVFNMSRSSIIGALEQLSNHPIYPIKFTRTNNLDTVRLPDITPLEYLEVEYKRRLEALV